MVIVQSEACAPMMQMFNTGRINPDFNPQASLAYGLAVPFPFAKDLMMNVVRESSGTVVTVTEDEILKGINEFARSEGLLLSPEGSATFIAMRKLVEESWINEDETVLLFNTGSWYKYHGV